MKKSLRTLVMCIVALLSAESFGIDLSDEQPTAEHKDDKSSLDADVQEVTLKVTCGCKGRELELYQQAAKEWEALTGHRVEIITLPNESNERLNLYLQLLRAESQDLDILIIDVTWPGILASYLIDLKEYFKGEIPEFFQVCIANNTIDGQLVAIPWYIDMGILYCRKDLLEKYGHSVPKTWDDLEKIATDIQDKERANGNSRMWGYVFQGKSYEGLTVNVVEWFCSAGGGIMDNKGKLAVDTPSNRRMLNMIYKWIGAVAPSGVLGYTEEEARGVFQSGNAVFMRSWPYAFALLSSPDCPLAGKVDVAPLPIGPGGRHVGILGGWSLGISKFSKHPKEAVAFLRYLTSHKEQRRRAIEGGISPSRPNLYKDKAMIQAQPFFAKLSDMLDHMVVRPSSQFGSLYSQASTEIFNSVHSMIAGHKPIDTGLKQLHKRLSQLLDRINRYAGE
ncbi:MAG: ABC transporter substrate-binding protein [Holosporales bacterium]|jgi:trehalose/maltose transport system substrate-binding protein|nr:ABC transporter substrate-binding protein [Holosporales bacterium]